MTDLATIPQRDGGTYQHDRDGHRLQAQHDAVFALMKDGVWRSPEAIEKALGGSWASLGARLRDCRKAEFGSHKVEREYVHNGLWLYRLVLADRELFD